MKLKLIKVISISAVLGLTLTSCQKKLESSFSIPRDSITIDVQSPTVNTDISVPRYRNEDHKTICVLFGYGFNTDSYYQDIRYKLKEEFGLAEDGGLIWTILYPDDLKSRITSLSEMINDKENIAGILMLGAPEKTHYALAKIQDYWNGDVPYPVFSYFPQDDILGSESTCDFVLEHERDAKEEAQSTEVESVDFDVEELLIRTIHYMIDLDSSIAYDKELNTHVKNITKGYKIYRYTDSESGLHPINHYILGKKEITN